MNFIFDIGNVLLNFKRMKFLAELFPNEPQEFYEKMHRTVFRSHEWEELDRGVITHEEACEILRKREPDYIPAINFLMGHLEDMLTPIPESIALLPTIKEAGHGLYYLSNYQKKLSAYVVNKYPFFKLFDGGVFSCDIHINKPSPGIYRHLLKTYGLDPKTCIFFDDMQENITAAEQEGIKGVLFTGAECLKEFTKTLHALEYELYK